MAEIGIIASVAGVAQAGVQLSHSLYHIANRLVNAPKQVAEVADELTLLSNIFQNLGETLNRARKLCKEDIIRHAESILKRFESLQKDVTELVKKIKGIERLKYAFGMSSISDLMAKIGALKSSMCLLLSTMHVAMQAQKRKRYGNFHQRYSRFNIPSAYDIEQVQEDEIFQSLVRGRSRGTISHPRRSIRRVCSTRNN
jgi:hypothetical protein